jgi:catechol 2,3-dioxygenase-like lactoylglutathione lyase family enzyme
MKRFHVHVAVNSLDESIQFYSKVFGAQPSVIKDDYAKWMLDDPRINFAISHRGQSPGINHLGLQAEDDAELEAIQVNLQSAGAAITPEKGANCCYAKSDKYWVNDPQGIAWEAFRSLGSIPMFGSDGVAEEPASCGSGDASASSCCPTPKAEKATSFCS